MEARTKPMRMETLDQHCRRLADGNANQQEEEGELAAESLFLSFLLFDLLL